MHRVAVLALDRVNSMNLSTPVQVFGTAHTQRKPEGALFGDPLYDIRVCGELPNLMVTGLGDADLYRMTPLHGLADAAGADTLVLANGQRTEPSAELLDLITATHARGARIMAISGGVYLLAMTGLLDGLRATCHWTGADELATRYPAVNVVTDMLYVREGKLITTAGATVSIDACIELIREDFGSAVAADVARHFIFAERDSRQPQLLRRKDPTETDSLEPLMHWMRTHLDEQLTLAELAVRAGISERTLSRRFREQTGTSPMRWRLRLRVHHAQELLETTSLSIEEIARLCGFGTSIALRQHFARIVRSSPRAYRRNFHH